MASFDSRNSVQKTQYEWPYSSHNCPHPTRLLPIPHLTGGTAVSLLFYGLWSPDFPGGNPARLSRLLFQGAILSVPSYICVYNLFDQNDKNLIEPMKQREETMALRKKNNMKKFRKFLRRILSRSE